MKNIEASNKEKALKLRKKYIEKYNTDLPVDFDPIAELKLVTDAINSYTLITFGDLNNFSKDIKILDENNYQPSVNRKLLFLL